MTRVSWNSAKSRRDATHTSESELLCIVARPTGCIRCRVVHGGGRAALATNRTTDAVVNPCEPLDAQAGPGYRCAKNNAFLLDQIQPCTKLKEMPL